MTNHDLLGLIHSSQSLPARRDFLHLLRIDQIFQRPGKHAAKRRIFGPVAVPQDFADVFLGPKRLIDIE